MRIRRSLAILALLFALPLGASALEAPDSLRVTWGVLVESLLNPSFAGNVSSPSVSFNVGAGVSMPFAPGSRFSFAPSADLYWYYSEFNSGQPVSADEAFSTTFTVGALLNAPIVYGFPLGTNMSLNFGLGLCFDVRFAFTSGDLAPGDAALSNAYFWGEGRFVAPSTLLRFDYALTERVGFGVSARVIWPIYNLWTGEGYGFLDQTKYVIDMVIRLRLSAKKADQPDSSQPPAPETPAASETPPA